MSSLYEWVFNPETNFIKNKLNNQNQKIKKNEVIVKSIYVGICGSDLFLIKQKFENLRLGHEWIGEVLETGSEVRNLQKGDIVTGVGHFFCEECQYCQKGFTNLCEKSIHFSSDKIGALRSQFIAPASQIIKINQKLDSAYALLEVFAVGEHAANLLKLDGNEDLEKNILIIGAGAIGLATAFVLKNKGYKITLIEKNLFRIQNARQAGFDCFNFKEILLK
ncbi:MAG: alcohol dehydrogenase catalytic domain-containing protein, partial [Bdellovibrionales bacterium]|nr:alcohol dehydrogenase catalytic domain-containing protein [Bdellovibrionales bacterium]